MTTLYLGPDEGRETVAQYLARTEPQALIDDAKLIDHYVRELGWQGLADHSIEHDPIER
jgi:hypothetical protein